jgi:predicted metal-binding membrane protein
MMSMAGAEASLARQGPFLGTAALLFTISAAVTVHEATSESMTMPWMAMPGQSGLHAAAGFLGMWLPMMVAMMLPSLLPMLWRYRRAVGAAGAARLDWLTALASVAYFAVWSAFGMIAFALGVVLDAVEMRVPAVGRAVPFAVGVALLVAGALQFTSWKAHQLACCRSIPGRERGLPGDAGTAWRHGLRCGLHCSYCCAGLTAVLFAVGVMDLRAMAVVAVAISLERLAPGGARLARAIGAVLIGAGMALLAGAL